MPRSNAALTLAAASTTPPGADHALREVLDRLGPSVFAGLFDPDGVLRYALHQACCVRRG